MKGILVIALLLSGCTTQEQWMAAGLSTRIGAQFGSGNIDSRGGKQSNDMDWSAVVVDVEPFKLWAWQMEEKVKAAVRQSNHYDEVILDAAKPPEQKPILPVPKPTCEKPK